jgi:histidinol-phosphatase (PHP family)
MIADYHIHTSLCGHAEGEPREYVEHAIELGMTEMGFSDHLPLLAGWEPGFTMRREDLDGCVTTVQDLAPEYAAEIRILLGIEVDYLVAIEESVLALLADFARAAALAGEAGYSALLRLSDSRPQALA